MATNAFGDTVDEVSTPSPKVNAFGDSVEPAQSNAKVNAFGDAIETPKAKTPTPAELAKDDTIDPYAMYAHSDPSKFDPESEDYQNAKSQQDLAIQIYKERQKNPLPLNVGKVLGNVGEAIGGLAKSTVTAPARAVTYGILKAAPSINPEQLQREELNATAAKTALKNQVFDPETKTLFPGMTELARKSIQGTKELISGEPKTDDDIRNKFESNAVNIRQVQKNINDGIAEMESQYGQPLTQEAKDEYIERVAANSGITDPMNLAFLGAGKYASILGKIGGRATGAIGKGITAASEAVPAIGTAIDATKTAGTALKNAAGAVTGVPIETAGKVLGSGVKFAKTPLGTGLATGATTLAVTGDPTKAIEYGVGGAIASGLGRHTKIGMLSKPVEVAASGLEKLGQKLQGIGDGVSLPAQAELFTLPSQAVESSGIGGRIGSGLKYLAKTDTAKGAASGAVMSLPMLLSAENKDEAATMLLTGTAFGAIGGLAEGNPNAAYRRSLAQKIAKDAPESYGANVTVDGNPFDIDSMHAENVKDLTPDQKLAVQAQRGMFPGAQIYVLKPGEMQALGINSRGAYDPAQIQTTTMVDGKPQKIILIDKDLMALNHESGHYAFDQLTPEQKSGLLDTVSKNVPAKTLGDAYLRYIRALASDISGTEIKDSTVNLDADGNLTIDRFTAKDQLDAIKQAEQYFANDPLNLAKEYIAEQFNSLAKGESLAGQAGSGKSIAQSLSDTFNGIRQKLTGEGSRGALGFEDSPQVQDAIRNALSQVYKDRVARGEVTGYEPTEPTPRQAPKTTIGQPTVSPTKPLEPTIITGGVRSDEDAIAAAKVLGISQRQILLGLQSAKDKGITDTESVVKEIVGINQKPVDRPADPVSVTPEKPLSTAEPIQPENTASVPMMVTKRMEADLIDLGYTQDEINKMTPADANKILSPFGRVEPIVSKAEPQTPGEPIKPLAVVQPFENIRVSEGQLSPKASIDPFRRTGEPSNVPPLSATEGTPVVGLTTQTRRIAPYYDSEGNIITKETSHKVGRAINRNNPTEVEYLNKAAEDSGNPETFNANEKNIEQAIASGKEVNATYRSSRSEVESSPTNQEREEAQRLSDLNLVPREGVQKTFTPTGIEVFDAQEPIFTPESADSAKQRAAEQYGKAMLKSGVGLKGNSKFKAFDSLDHVSRAIDEVVKANNEGRLVSGLTPKQVEVIVGTSSTPGLLDTNPVKRMLTTGYSQDKVIANAKNFTSAVEQSDLLKDPALRQAYDYLKSGEWSKDLKNRNENMANGWRGDGGVFLGAKGQDINGGMTLKSGLELPANRQGEPVKIDDWKIQVLNAIEGGPSTSFYREAQLNAETAGRKITDKPLEKSTNPFYEKLADLGDKLYLSRGDKKIEGVKNIIAPASETLRLDRIESTGKESPIELPPSSYAQRAAGFMPRGALSEVKPIEERRGLLSGVGKKDDSTRYMPNTPGFYSQLERTIKEKMPNNASAEQIRNIIKSGGVKADEIKWSGIDDYLTEHPKSTKQEVLDYLNNEGSIRVTQKTIGKNDSDIADWYNSKPFVKRESDRFENMPEYDREYAREDYAQEFGLDPEQVRRPEFAEYAIPGGSNYKETVVRFPKGEAFEDKRHYPGIKDYLSHIRTSDRVDAEGKQGMLIDESQSTRHEMGRDKGYSRSTKEIQAEQKQVEDQLTKLGITPESDTTKFTPEVESLIERSYELSKELGNNTGVTEAPFEKLWPELNFKIALKEAIESGKDWIGWTPGEVQAERYNLSEKVQSINANRIDKEHGLYNITVKLKDGQTSTKDGVAERDLSNMVGKDIAKMIVEQPHNAIEIKGQDLQVGGNGQVGFYDEVMPNKINKLVKKFGGKVSEGYLSDKATEEQRRDRPLAADLAEGKTPFWKVEITPEMRKSVSEEGQALFMPRGGKDAPADYLADWDLPGRGKVKLYNLNQDIEGHKKGSTLTEDTLRSKGYRLPDDTPQEPMIEGESMRYDPSKGIFTRIERRAKSPITGETVTKAWAKKAVELLKDDDYFQKQNQKKVDETRTFQGIKTDLPRERDIRMYGELNKGEGVPLRQKLKPLERDLNQVPRWSEERDARRSELDRLAEEGKGLLSPEALKQYQDRSMAEFASQERRRQIFETALKIGGGVATLLLAMGATSALTPDIESMEINPEDLKKYTEAEKSFWDDVARRISVNQPKEPNTKPRGKVLLGERISDVEMTKDYAEQQDKLAFNKEARDIYWKLREKGTDADEAAIRAEGLAKVRLKNVARLDREEAKAQAKREDAQSAEIKAWNEPPQTDREWVISKMVEYGLTEDQAKATISTPSWWRQYKAFLNANQGKSSKPLAGVQTP